MKKLHFLFLAILLFGCQNYYLTDAGGKRPKRPRFKIQPTAEEINNFDFNLLDTNAVYLHKFDTSLFTGATTDLYIFLRFFSDGSLFNSYVIEGYPTLNDVNNIESGITGFYKIEGDKLTYEVFAHIYARMQYFYYYCNLSEDYLIKTKAKLRNSWPPHTTDFNDKYIKIPISDFK